MTRRRYITEPEFDVHDHIDCDPVAYLDDDLHVLDEDGTSRVRVAATPRTPSPVTASVVVAARQEGEEDLFFSGSGQAVAVVAAGVIVAIVLALVIGVSVMAGWWS